MDTTELDSLKATLDKHRPLEESIMRNLREDLKVRWTYNSNAIEGNTLTLKETKVVLEGVTVSGKSLVEHLEATNHAQAIDLVYELLENKTPFSEWVIKEIHAIVLQAIDRKSAGVYRTANVVISGAEHTPPSFLHVPEQMAQFFEWFNNHQDIMHPVELAARVHVDFVKIHPFIDGNGRTSRLLMNFILMRGGFPPVVINATDRLSYYEALDTAHTTGNYEPFFSLTHRLVKASFEPYWFALGLNG